MKTFSDLKGVSKELLRSEVTSERWRSTMQHLNDALILATADELQDVELLYSEDSGVQGVASYATGIRVEALPNPKGPLFAHLPEHSRDRQRFGINLRATPSRAVSLSG
jgi:hypothetical protein